MRTALVGAIALSLVALVVLLNVWLWRDMASRDRPAWLRVTVLVLMWVVQPIGLFVWMMDRSKHPHDPSVSRWQQVRQQREVSST